VGSAFVLSVRGFQLHSLVVEQPVPSDSPIARQVSAHGQCQGHRCSGTRGGDPLIVTVRETAFEVRLESQCPALGVPGTIVDLSVEQEPWFKHDRT
jgi:hypothetical protein